MPTQLKLADILNILSIGILFQLILFCFVYNVKKEILIESIGKLDSTVITGLAIIFSFPAWRLVSNFVDYVMSPRRQVKKPIYNELKKEDKAKETAQKVSINIFTALTYYNLKISSEISSLYRLLFFDLKKTEGIAPSILITKLKTQLSSVNILATNSIREIFKIDISTLTTNEHEDLYYLIKSYISVNRKDNQTLLYERYHMVLNYHVRLAILCNFITLISIMSLAYNFVDEFYFSTPIKDLSHDIYLYTLILSIIGSKHFGGLCRIYNNSGIFLLIMDFNNVAKSNN